MTTLKSQHYDFAASLVAMHFGIQKNDFTIEDMEKAKNNHVYLIHLEQPLAELGRTKSGVLKPYTSAIPVGTSKMVLRISKNNVNLEDSVRIRNEVAFLALARDALSAIDASVIPRVFGWEDKRWEDRTSIDPVSLSWILEEFMEGDSLRPDEILALDHDTRKSLLYQIAQVVKAFQDYQLPGAVSMYGALKFDEQGEIVNTISTLPCGMSNLLFNRGSNRLSAVLDFDFAHIGAPISEYLFSFWDLDGLLPGSSDPNDPLRNHILKGFPFAEEEEGVEDKWKLTRAWENALSDVGAEKPSTIDKAGDIADIWWFSQDLCEAYWFIDTFLEKRTPEKLEEFKAVSASNLEKYLAHWGF
ncbi:unnamed protein product [Penicillium palitans]